MRVLGMRLYRKPTYSKPMSQSIVDIEEILKLGIMHGLGFSLKLKEKPVQFVGVEKYNSKLGLNLVELKPLTLHGTRITETVFHISEIERLAVLNVLYDDPVYAKLRKLKSMISAI
jgi:hypothetical protein